MTLRDPKDVMIGSRTLRSVIESHSRWLAGDCGYKANLSGANLSKASLRAVDLRRANLSGANLSDAYICGANLSGANLSDADLCGAGLSGANLSDASIGGANLSGANLSKASLRWASLCGADLRGADLRGANFRNANLSEANLGGVMEFVPAVLGLHSRVCELVGDGENLDMSIYHSDCGTRHCRAGYAILAAGDRGMKLEQNIGTNAAAALIYHVSTGMIPDFYADLWTAFSDIRECAGASS